MHYGRIVIPYFKQGDDFHHFLENSDSLPNALNCWADALSSTADNLREISKVVTDYPQVSGDGDTHWAALYNLPDEAFTRLLKNGLIEKDLLEDEEE